MADQFDHALADQEFRALVDIDRADDDLHIDAGETFKGGSFSKTVIENWLRLKPQPAIEEAKPFTRSEVINAFGQTAGRILIDAGFATIASVPRNREDLLNIEGIGPARADQILDALADMEGGD